MAQDPNAPDSKFTDEPQFGLLQELEPLRGKRGRHTARRMPERDQKAAGILFLHSKHRTIDIRDLHQFKTDETRNTKYLVIIMPTFKNGNAFDFFQKAKHENLFPNLKEIYGWYWQDAMPDKVYRKCVKLWCEMNIKVVALGDYPNDRDGWLLPETIEDANLWVQSQGHDLKLANIKNIKTPKGDGGWIAICSKLGAD